MPLDYYYLGDVKNVETHTCLDTMGRRTGENVGISYCHGLGGNQVCILSLMNRNISNIILEIKSLFLFRILSLMKTVLLRYLPIPSGNR